MRRIVIATIALGLATVLFAPETSAAAKKAKSAQPACLNALACGPQPVPKMRKPKNEKFMRSAS
jgi:hypothetical protein